MRHRRAPATGSVPVAVALALLATFAPASPASPEPLPGTPPSGTQPSGAPPPGSAVAVPDSRPGCRLVSAPADLATPAQAGSCSGVRPGAPVFIAGGRCSFGFLWLGSDGHRYMGTAGHCLLDSEPAEVVFDVGRGPLARDVARRAIGEVAYAALDETTDLALVRLFPDVGATPSVCVFGGPTALGADRLPPVSLLHHVGWGVATGSLLGPRTQIATDRGDPFYLTGIGIASSGDSGSPVVDSEGRAVANVVATGLTVPLLSAGPLVHSVRVGPAIERASNAIGVDLTLATAPLAKPGLLR